LRPFHCRSPDDLWQRTSHRSEALADYDSMLGKENAQLVGQRGPLFDHLLTHWVHRLHIQLSRYTRPLFTTDQDPQNSLFPQLLQGSSVSSPASYFCTQSRLRLRDRMWGCGGLTATDRARYAPPAGVPVALDSMRVSSRQNWSVAGAWKALWT